jgi:hypothetical protein
MCYQGEFRVRPLKQHLKSVQMRHAPRVVVRLHFLVQLRPMSIVELSQHLQRVVPELNLLQQHHTMISVKCTDHRLLKCELFSSILPFKRIQPKECTNSVQRRLLVRIEELKRYDTKVSLVMCSAPQCHMVVVESLPHSPVVRTCIGFQRNEPMPRPAFPPHISPCL